MRNDSHTSKLQNPSTPDEIEAFKEKLLNREVLCNVSHLVTELYTHDKYFEDLAGLIGEEDDEGNMPEVYEYWAVTSWFAEKLKAHGELVVEFFNLDIWGRQTTGQAISLDGVIDDIARELLD